MNLADKEVFGGLLQKRYPNTAITDPSAQEMYKGWCLHREYVAPFHQRYQQQIITLSEHNEALRRENKDLKRQLESGTQ